MINQELPPHTVLDYDDYGGTCIVFETGDYVGRHATIDGPLKSERVMYYWSTSLQAGKELVRFMVEQQNIDKREPVVEVHTANESGMTALTIPPMSLGPILPSAVYMMRTGQPYDGLNNGLNIQWAAQNSPYNVSLPPMDSGHSRLQVSYDRNCSQLGRVAKLAAQTGSFVIQRASPKVIYDLNAMDPLQKLT